MTTLPYFVLRDGDHYLSGHDQDGALAWLLPHVDTPDRFETLTAARDFIAAFRLDPEQVVIRLITPPSVDSIVQFTADVNWCGERLNGRLAQVEDVTDTCEGVLLTVLLWNGWYADGTPAFGSRTFAWAHEVRPASLPAVGQAVTA